VTARYEVLRQAALGLVPPTGHGLAVVMHRGVSVWMAVAAALSDPVPETGTNGGAALVAGTVVSEVVRVVADVALGAVCARGRPDE
jgi:hypothetical protein